MSAVDFFFHGIGGEHLKRVLDFFQQVALVLFDRQDIVGLFVDDLPGDGPLPAHRIDRHDGPAQLQCVQQLGDGRDLVGSIILKTAVKSVGERQRVVSVALCTATHLTKMVKSSMFATVFALNQLAILTHFGCRF